MRIGIDGRELLGQRTGVGRYLAALCTEWVDNPDHGHHFVVYTPTAPDLEALGPPFVDRQTSAFTHRLVAGHPGTWWEQIQLPRVANRDRLDLFFAPAYSAPLRLDIPCVMTMHDVSFAAHPEWFRWREGARRRWLASQAMTRAAAVLTVSEFSRDEIVRCFDVPRDRVHVVRHGIQHRPSGPPAADGSRRLVLYAGSIFNRRHLPTLIRAFAKIARDVPDIELTVVGANRTYPSQDLTDVARRRGIHDRMTLHAYVPDDTLDALYERAAVFVFLSEYEGFGLPPLEAMAAGVPVVVGDTPVAREIYGEAALRVPPADVTATADAISRLLGDAALRTRQRAHADALLPTFRWERAARETLSVMETAARTT